jgi:hypothetical protein
VLHAGAKRRQHLLAEADGHEDDVVVLVFLARFPGLADLAQERVRGQGVVQCAVVEHEHWLLQVADLAAGVVDEHGVELGAAVVVPHRDRVAVDLLDLVPRLTRGLDDGDVALVTDEIEALDDGVRQLVRSPLAEILATLRSSSRPAGSTDRP